MAEERSPKKQQRLTGDERVILYQPQLDALMQERSAYRQKQEAARDELIAFGLSLETVEIIVGPIFEA